MQTTPLLAAGLALLVALAPAQTNLTEEKKAMNVKKMTPILFVNEIEPVLPFWVDRLGFQKTAEVPEGNKLGFVILQKGNVEVMYQTYASVDKDMPAIAQAVRRGSTFLYVEVDNLNAVIEATKGVEIYLPVRTTFYGAKEIGVKDPAGHFITFAQFNAPPQH
jgi:uncharacterized glyoxalase superfamily protein PhnB